VWVTFLVILGVYAVLAATTILVLRSMARRWRQGQDVGAPYAPSESAGPRADTT
jgi:hypothetical protein